MSKTWSIAEAKAKFSEVVDLAQSHGPQTVTRNGRTAVVIVGAEEWERKSKRSDNLAEFFAASPLRGSRLNLRRNVSDFETSINDIIDPWSGEG